MYILYGIPNCSTVKKARKYLETLGVAYQFHNYKTEGITVNTLKNWCKTMNWDILLNKKSTTWRGLDETTKKSITSQAAAVRLMQKHTSLIKRPVMEKDQQIVAVGFDSEQYKTLFEA